MGMSENNGVDRVCGVHRVHRLLAQVLLGTAVILGCDRAQTPERHEVALVVVDSMVTEGVATTPIAADSGVTAFFERDSVWARLDLVLGALAEGTEPAPTPDRLLVRPGPGGGFVNAARLAESYGAFLYLAPDRRTATLWPHEHLCHLAEAPPDGSPVIEQALLTDVLESCVEGTESHEH